MKWKIENVGVHCNILLDDGKSNMDSEPVGLGFPPALAEKLVTAHNEAIDKLQKEIDELKLCIHG